MLPTRDPRRDKRRTHTESEGLETYFPSKQKRRKTGVAILIPDKIDFKKMTVKRDPEGHFIILKGRIHHQDIHIVNMLLKQEHQNTLKKILEDYKKDIDSNTIIVGDFNTPMP